MLGEGRLADAGRARDRDGASGAEQLREPCTVVATTAERHFAALRPPARADRRHRHDRDRPALALDRDRLGRSHRELRPGAVGTRPRGHQHPLGGVAREPRGKVRRIAHRRVGLAEGRADEAREDATGCRSRLDRVGRVGRHDAVQSREQAAFRVLDRPRRPGREEVAESARCGIDVEQGRSGDLDRLLDHPGEPIDLGDHGVVDHVGQPADRGEAHGGPAVIGLGRQQVGALEERAGEEDVGVFAGDIAQRHERLRRDRPRPGEPATHRAGLLDAHLAGRQRVGGLRADQDASGAGRRLQTEHVRRVTADDHGVAGLLAGEDDIEATRVHAHRHPQSGSRRAQPDIADGGQHPLHDPRGVRGTALVRGPAVEDQQRVAGELQHVAAVVGRRQQHGEDAGEGGDQLFGALPSGCGEPFRQHRESRDVDEHDGAVHRETAGVG